MNPEDITDFNQLFDPAEGHGGGGIAVAQLERIFGSVIRLVQGGEFNETGSNWLVTSIALFNAAGLMIVVLISLYTILTVVFDTASDGKTFGQGTDTRYTILRGLAGAIFFIPVAKGFTIAQIGLLWLIIQGSALADTTWAYIAENNIQGQNFIQPSRVQGTVDAAIASEFADALNAFVVGNICANGLNSINSQVTGEPDAKDVVEFMSKEEDVVKNQYAVDAYKHTPYITRNVRRYWQDTSEQYRGSTNICGGVSMQQTMTFDKSGTDIFDQIRASAANKLVVNYKGAIDMLANDAQSIANMIRLNDSSDNIAKAGVSAVRRAQIAYISGLSDAITGASGQNELSQAIEQVQKDVVKKVTNDGWILAPSWQRGISLATSEYRSTIGSLDLDVKTENNARWFLSNNNLDSSIIGWRDENPIAAQVMAEMDQHQNTWGTIAGRVLSEVRTNGIGATAMAGGVDEVDGIINNLFAMLIDLFAVRDDGGYSDPMIDVTEYGQGVMTAGGALAAAGAAANWAPLAGALSGGPTGLAIGTVISDIGETILSPLGWGLFAAGFITFSLIPLLPLIYFISAVVSWLILVVEAMFGLPLAVLTLFAPSRGSTLIGSWNRILLTIFGVFLRPMFTIVGFFFGMLLIAVVLDLAYGMFRDIILMMQTQGSVTRIMSLLGVVMAFVIVTFYTVLLGSGMITQIGDGAMSAIGIAFSNSQGAMNVGEQTHHAMNVSRAINPIPMGRLGGGDGGSRALPGRTGGPDGGSGGGGNSLVPNGGMLANIGAKGLRGPGAVAGALKGAAPTVAGKAKGERAAALGKAMRTQFGPLKGRGK